MTRFYAIRTKKGSSVMSLFWSALAIFIITVESLIFLMIVSVGNSGSKVTEIITQSGSETVTSLDYDCFGPIIPIFLMSDANLIDEIQHGTSSSRYDAFRMSFEKMNLNGYDLDSFTVTAVDKPGTDATYGFTNNRNKYSEIFYYKTRLGYYRIELRLSKS